MKTRAIWQDYEDNWKAGGFRPIGEIDHRSQLTANALGVFLERDQLEAGDVPALNPQDLLLADSHTVCKLHLGQIPPAADFEIGYKTEATVGLMAAFAQSIPAEPERVFDEAANIPCIEELREAYVPPVAKLCAKTLQML